MNKVSQTAHVNWNETKNRYELHILGKLKAYSEGDAPTKEAHAGGRGELIKMATKNGYFVKEGVINGDGPKD